VNLRLISPFVVLSFLTFFSTVFVMVQNEVASITLEEKACLSQTVWYGSAIWVSFLELFAGWRLDILMLVC
jgi:hypothetical protein